MTSLTSSGPALLRAEIDRLRALDPELTDARVARDHLRTTPASLSSWLSGKNTPGRISARIIALWSGGRIPVESWDSTDDKALLGSIRLFGQAA